MFFFEGGFLLGCYMVFVSCIWGIWRLCDWCWPSWCPAKIYTETFFESLKGCPWFLATWRLHVVKWNSIWITLICFFFLVQCFHHVLINIWCVYYFWTPVYNYRNIFEANSIHPEGILQVLLQCLPTFRDFPGVDDSGHWPWSMDTGETSQWCCSAAAVSKRLGFPWFHVCQVVELLSRFWDVLYVVKCGCSWTFFFGEIRVGFMNGHSLLLSHHLDLDQKLV